MSRLVALGALSVALVVLPSAASADDPDSSADPMVVSADPVVVSVDPVAVPAEQVVVEVVTVNGDGCLPGTVAVRMQPDNQAIAVHYSDFLVDVGLSATSDRASCQLALVIHAPERYVVGVTEAHHQGYVELAAGASGWVREAHYLRGETPDPAVRHTFTGPTEDNWEYVDETPADSVAFSTCGAPAELFLSTQLGVEAGTSRRTADNYLLRDSADGYPSSLYRLAWRVCP